MSQCNVSLSSVAAGSFAAVFLFFSVLIGGGDAFAQSSGRPTSTPFVDGRIADVHRTMTEPHDAPIANSPLPLRRPPPTVPPYEAPAEPGDALAALEAIEIALTQASDGSTYIWRRNNGRLAGAFRPTSTFRDADGRFCRHLEMRMRLGTYQRLMEGIACRGMDGVWILEG